MCRNECHVKDAIMKKSLILLALAFISMSGCTVVVSDPHPRYIVREVSYEGTRPAEVYYYGGYYYYAPCDHIHSRYYHTRVSHYNSHSMRVVTYQRPVNTVVIKEPAHHHQNTVIIKEPAHQHNTVIIKEQAPPSKTVIIKEQAPQRNNTVIIKKEETPRNNVIIKNKDPVKSSNSNSGNKVIIKK